MRLFLRAFGLLLPSLLAFSASGHAFPAGLPAPPRVIPPRDARIARFQGQIQRGRVLSAYRGLIEIYKNVGWYDEAARLHMEQVPLYEARGLTDAAVIQRNAAFDLRGDLRAFTDVHLSAASVGKLATRARAEPTLGCYLGAFIDRDDALGAAFMDENYQSHRSPDQMFAATGRHPGSLFMYMSYGQGIPRAWLERLKNSGCIPQIAWEPRDLRRVQDDEYLRSFARGLAKLNWPVFIRFASEMNGTWTPYHSNPTLYREKFRLVNRVLHQYAPRVATIWCVGNPPLKNIDAYYPGDDGCDWVGVNFYSVPFHDNNPNRPAFDENPLGLLDPIYTRYAALKPIAICEFAASHQSSVSTRSQQDFAIEKLRLLYGALPLLYPRVKLIDWFDADTLAHSVPGKTRSNFLLTERADVLNAWQGATQHPTFLPRVPTAAEALPPVALPLQNRSVPNGATVRLWARTYDPNAHVFMALDDTLVANSLAQGAVVLQLNALPGRHVLTAFLYDSKNRFQRQIRSEFTVK